MPYDECGAPTAADATNSADAVTPATTAGQPATPGDWIPPMIGFPSLSQSTQPPLDPKKEGVMKPRDPRSE